jgi:hypothetical protein
VSSFAGFVVKQPVELILQKESSNLVRGVAYFASSNKTVNLRGEFEPDGNLALQLTDEYGEKQGQLRGPWRDIREWKGQFIHLNQSKDAAQFTLRESLLMGCLDYADYTSSYDVTYPKTRSDAFNASMEKLVNDWVSRCRIHFNRQKANTALPEPANRAGMRASGWSQVSYLGEEAISGVMIFSTTWSAVPETRSFNFDPKTGREIQLADLFVKGFDYRKFVDQAIRQQLPKHPRYKDADFKNWIDREPFPHFTLRRDGLCLATGFNAFYGQLEVIIPYRALEPNLVKESAVWGVARK